jgi:hypothetical protein
MNPLRWWQTQNEKKFHPKILEPVMAATSTFKSSFAMYITDTHCIKDIGNYGKEKVVCNPVTQR